MHYKIIEEQFIEEEQFKIFLTKIFFYASLPYDKILVIQCSPIFQLSFDPMEDIIYNKRNFNMLRLNDFLKCNGDIYTTYKIRNIFKSINDFITNCKYIFSVVCNIILNTLLIQNNIRIKTIRIRGDTKLKII